MAGILDQMEKGITTFLKELNKQRTASSSYAARAEQAQYQEALVAAMAEKQNNYLLQSAAEKAQTVYQNYLQTQSAQQVQTALSGLRADSATVQYMRKNSRFQALLEQQRLADELQVSVYENNEQAAAQIRALKQSAEANRRAARKGLGGVSVKSVMTKLLGGY